MRKCTKCSKLKDPAMFFVKDKQSGRLHSQCKDCYRSHRVTYSALHYAKYGDAYRLRAKVRRAAIRKRLQSKMIDYLNAHPCVLCKEKDIRTLEFDHVNPEMKSFGIAKAITDGKKWGDIMVEIKKCRVLCANCHKKHTAHQNGWYKNQNKIGGTYG